MKRRTFLVASALACVGCSGQPSSDSEPGSSGSTTSTTDEKKPKLVATTAMVADIVRQVAGKQADVTGLLGESVDPHIYQPNRGDMSRMGAADAVFYSGLLLEGKFGDAFEQLKKSGKPVIAVTEEIDEDYLRYPKDFEGHPDPHVWMDVSAWSQCVDVVARQLAILRPSHTDAFADNAQRYQTQLSELHEYAKRVIASIPEPQRVLVTAHDAFGYFGRAYNIEVRSPQGITTESSPGVNDINRIVDFLVERKLPAIFVESSVSRENIKAIIEGAERRGVDVGLKGPLYSDAMGPAGTYEGTYVGMIDHNATLITRALGGKAPAGGMQGKLTAKPA